MGSGSSWTRAAAAGFVLAAAIAVLGLFGSSRASSGDAAVALGQRELVARGEYLVRVTGCGDCHTPFVMGPNGPEPDTSRLLAGHPHEFIDAFPVNLPDAPGFWMWSPTGTMFVGAFGTSYSANLTPDQNTGLGIWTEDMFIKAMRTGRHFGTSSPILPPMPWPAYAAMTDQDLRAVFAYLRSIPPVANRVPDSEPAN